MSSPASIAGHPFHPMLVAFPIGLWVFSLVCDIVYLSGGNPAWGNAAMYTMGGGIIGALVAAAPGFIDWLSIREAHARNIGLWHMGLNVMILVLFVINFFWRVGTAPSHAGPFVLTIIADAFLLASGWLGGSMVYVNRVAVDPGASPMRQPYSLPHVHRHEPGGAAA